ncbi:MAG: aminotransferase class III-fold pyridoxal phosphate-dependent enzyme [Oceanospirillaceae bacterium]|nr:aminotransferase class III-fold pyridoxal phosphate-dependent enzyme [Oceanospirillaceae bacterium]MCP5350105.1 aminotransferase class III-fold pyridoxal phosphate-dependent enzyme [Oceanospirillaceae bacterium]
MSRYQASEDMLDRALQCIPLGTQTFSKSYKHYPRGVSPFYIESGKGAILKDIDGNEFIDLVSSLAAVTLGYADDEINAAVEAQLKKGCIFSLPSPPEVYLSELLVDIIPCAQMVRFGKNASDATTAAVRVSRAFTGRNRIAVCGYHGWHDWYIGSTPKNRGVPGVVSELTSVFKYNDIASLSEVFSRYPDDVAAVVMEPMNVAFPQPGFLQEVRSLCDQYGAVLVFDETVTGFRLAEGGAQEYFGVVPDLACFGKGMANGFPLSAVVGKNEIMSLFDEVFFSFTFGGELLSIAAAIAVIKKYQREDVVMKIRKNGIKLVDGLKKIFADFNIEDFFNVSGYEGWSFINFNFSDEEYLYKVRTIFMQESLANGLITLGSNNLSFSHDELIIERVLSAYTKVFKVIATALQADDIDAFLRVEPLQPLFKPRS